MRVVNFKKLIFQNFLSFGNAPTEVVLDTKLSTMILGDNKDSGKEGYSKNGVGKSSFFQAFFWTLFGEGIENIKQDDFINLRNKKRMWCKLIFDVDGIEYVIERGRKPNVLSLTKAGEPFTLHSTATIDESIRGLLGINPEIFLNAFLLTKSDKNYMNLKPASQREFMETLLTMDILSKRASAIKAEAKDVSTEIKIEENRIQQVQRTNERTQASIASLVQKAEDWQRERECGTEEYEKALRELQDAVDVEHELELIKELETIQGELADVSKDVEKLQQQVERTFQKAEACQHEVESLERGECPYCHQQYLNELLIDQKREEIKAYQQSLDELEEAILPLLDREESLTMRLNTFIAENPDLLTKDECHQILNEIKQLKDLIDASKQEMTNPYLDQIEVLKKSLEDVDSTKLYELKKYETHCNLLVKLLTDSKGFIRKSIIDQYVPFLNNKINAHLSVLESPHIVTMNPDLTVDIEYMGHSISYGNLSNGEKLRVNLAVALAFRELIGVSTKFNIMMVDELLDSGMDEAGFNGALKLFNSLGTSTFIISHREDLMTKVDQKMIVTKQGGFSTISYETGL